MFHSFPHFLFLFFPSFYSSITLFFPYSASFYSSITLFFPCCSSSYSSNTLLFSLFLSLPLSASFFPPSLSTIMAAANILTSPPRVRHCQTLAEWLQLLNLSHLEPHFEGYSLSKVATFWDVQLTSVRWYCFGVGSSTGKSRSCLHRTLNI